MAIWSVTRKGLVRSMALRRCRECGLPLRLSRNYVWLGNGTIFARHDPAMRMVVFEAGYYHYAWSELEDRLGLSMADAMIRGQHAATLDYLEEHILYGWRKYALPRLPSRLIFQRIINEIAIFGFGGIEIMDYQRGKLVVLKVKHPFDIISLAWGIKGFIEFVERKGSELAWNEEDGDYTLSVILLPKGREAESIDREALRAVREAKRELSLVGKLLPPKEEKREMCASCGLPRALAELEWREADGAIYRYDTDRRFIFTSGHILLGVIRDLERRTGRELDPVVLDITRNYHLHILRGIPIRTRGGAYRSMARYLITGGFGDVLDLSYGEGHLEMTIGNPFYIPRLVGRITGLFEYIEGQDAEVEYQSPEPQILKLKIKST